MTAIVTMRSFVSALCVAVTLGVLLPTTMQGAKAQDRPVAPATPAVTVALPPELAYARFIAMIRGHLLAGDDLAAAKRWDGAARHYGFPREEVYGVIRGDLAAYRTPAFDSDLRTLVRAARAQNARQVEQARGRIDKALAAADANLKSHASAWPGFVLRTAVELLKVAPDEYEDAVVKGRVLRPLGYQTARGYVRQADRMIEAVRADLPDNTALAGLRADVARLKEALGPAVPRGPAPVPPVELAALVDRIEASARTLSP